MEPTMWLRPQSSRVLPPVVRRGAALLLPGAQEGLMVPRGTRRIVVFSNVPDVAAAAAVQPGDFVVHINRARQFSAVRGVPGVVHVLVVRRGRDRRTGSMVWYEPPSVAGFQQVVRVADVQLRARRRWWQVYCRTNPGKCPTTGFICWHLAREVAPGVQVVLAGFAPGRDCGTYRWPQHAWDYEAAVYAREGACVLPPKEFFLT